MFRHRRLAPLAAAVISLLAGPVGAADYVWTAGNLSNQSFASGVTINDTLWIGCMPESCGGKYLDQSFTSSASVTATDTLYFLYPSHGFSNGWTYALQGDVGLVNAYAGGSFVNEATGTLVKTAGSGDSVISISLASRGGSVLDATVGSLVFSAGDSSFDSGAMLTANAGARIAFTGGSVSFATGVRFLGAGQYQIGTNASFGGEVGAAQWAFTNGNYSGGDGSAGSRATLVSNASWTGNGSLQGSWLLGAGTTLAASGGGGRYIRGTVVNEGTLRTDDANLYFEYAAYSLANSGRIELQGDGGLVNAYAGGTLLNTGTLAKTAGTGTSFVSGINVSNSGLIDVQTGTLQFSGGSLDFAEGTRFSGAGTVLVSSSARFTGRIDSQNLVLAGAAFEGGNADLHGATRWTGGQLTGTWTLAADHTLTVDGGSSHYIRGNVSNLGRIDSSEHLYFEYPSYQLDNRGTLQLQGDVGLVNVYAGGTLLNSGTLVKSAGSGTSPIAGLTSRFSDGSLLQVQSGRLEFSNGGTQFDAAAVLQVAAGAELRFTGGQTTLADGVSLQGDGLYTLAGNSSVLGRIAAQHLILASGNHTGGDGTPGSTATLASDAVWTGSGSLQGQWQVQAGRTLAVQGDGSRYIKGVVVNQGTLRSNGPLYFEYPSYSIDNRSRLELQGDVGLVNVYAGGTLLNTGTLVKTAGSGTSLVSGINVSNSGLIEVQSGALQFGGGNLDFTDGTRFTGAGTVIVSSGARFAGRIEARQLVLASASYEGDSAEMHGSTRWTGGSLNGAWTLAADHTLAVDGGNSHTLRASVVNLGRINASDNLYFEYPSHQLHNRGTLDLQGDVGLVTTYVGGTLLNSGRLVKSGGEGESNLASVSVVNTGVIEVRSGTLRLPANFGNQGVLTGSGRLAASGTLSNTGRIEPGASPGTLTLDSHLLLGDGGVLALELQDSAQHDRLVVNGDLVLGGELALSCYADCSFAAGTDILVLDGTGSLSGQFTSVTWAGFAPGDLSVVVDGANADVWLHVNRDITAAVPEPASWALMLGGVAALLSLRRRRRD
jgi:hypothetical protein